MLTIYPACIFKEEDGYSVVFTDLNWLATCGETLEQAMEAAVDCLAGYIYMGRKEGEEIAPPSKMEAVDINKIAEELETTSENAFVNVIAVDVEIYAKEHFEKAVKKTLTIPSWLNKIATEQNINFSQVLQEALLAKVKMK